MDLCESCGTDLLTERNPSLHCSRCGTENDTREYVFACSEATRVECEWCDERLCTYAGG